MDKTLAEIILTTSIRSAREISSLAPLVKNNCHGDDYEVLSKAIGIIVYDIYDKIEQYIYSLYPELRAEVEERISKYGRAT